jgi:hypothetical protein
MTEPHPSCSRWVECVVRQIFPGVAKRFDSSAKSHREQGIVPLFGVYWNLCINAAFSGQLRIHCGPHADRKNIVGICTLLVYELPGGKPSTRYGSGYVLLAKCSLSACFNHTMRSWLVIWEAGVVVELPPWVLLLYPSSLLYHFNVDIDGECSFAWFLHRAQAGKAIKFVMTDGRQRPTPRNSRPIKEGDEFGRGSLVYFNQATMYQPSEIGYATIREAVEAGCSGKVDYGTSAQEAFTKYASLVPVKRC